MSNTLYLDNPACGPAPLLTGMQALDVLLFDSHDPHWHASDPEQKPCTFTSPMLKTATYTWCFPEWSKQKVSKPLWLGTVPSQHHHQSGQQIYLTLRPHSLYPYLSTTANLHSWFCKTLLMLATTETQQQQRSLVQLHSSESPVYVLGWEVYGLVEPQALSLIPLWHHVHLWRQEWRCFDRGLGFRISRSVLGADAQLWDATYFFCLYADRYIMISNPVNDLWFRFLKSFNI